MNDNQHSTHLDLEAQAAAADALLTNDLHSVGHDVAQHLESCHACRKAVMELVDISSELQSEQRESEAVHVPNKREGGVAQWVAIAASVALLIAVGLLWNENNQLNQRLTDTLEAESEAESPVLPAMEEDTVKEPEAEMSVEQTAAVESETDALKALVDAQEEVIDKAFEPNAMFEDQLVLAMRSGGSISAQPANTAFTGNQVIPFTWDHLEGELAVLVYNNRGLMIQQYLNVSSGHELDAGQLTPGTYYWKLATEKEVHFLGKFTIDQPRDR